MSLPVLHDIGAAITTNNHLLPVPATTETIKQNGVAYGTVFVGAGTFYCPANCLPMFVVASGTADIRVTPGSSSSAIVLTSGQAALVYPVSASSVVAVRLASAVAPTVQAAKITTSSTATTVTPGAGALTGANHVFWVNTADGALGLTTRTADQLISDVWGASIGAAVGYTYLLTIVNQGDNTITITGGSDVTVTGTNTLATLVTRTFVVEFSQGTVTMTSVSKGTIET